MRKIKVNKMEMKLNSKNKLKNNIIIRNILRSPYTCEIKFTIILCDLISLAYLINIMYLVFDKIKTVIEFL